MLRSLRPEFVTDIKLLSQLAETLPASELLPSKLSESILLSLALDLRRVELMWKGGDHAIDSLSVAMYLAMKYLMQISSPKKANKISIEEDVLYQAVQILALSIEREIVTRIVGVSDERSDEYLLRSLKNLRA